MNCFDLHMTLRRLPCLQSGGAEWSEELLPKGQESYLCPSVYFSPLRDEPPFLRTYECRLLPNEIPGKPFKSFLKIVLRNKCKNEMASKQKWNDG